MVVVVLLVVAVAVSALPAVPPVAAHVVDSAVVVDVVAVEDSKYLFGYLVDSPAHPLYTKENEQKRGRGGGEICIFFFKLFSVLSIDTLSNTAIFFFRVFSFFYTGGRRLSKRTGTIVCGSKLN